MAKTKKPPAPKMVAAKKADKQAGKGAAKKAMKKGGAC